MPLYVIVAPNEKFALEITIKIIFERLEGIRPNALVIDKSWIEYISLKNVIKIDRYCWEMVCDERQQKSCFILLCWFHVKKAWVDNLLPKVHGTEKDKLYKCMCQLML